MMFLYVWSLAQVEIEYYSWSLDAKYDVNHQIQKSWIVSNLFRFEAEQHVNRYSIVAQTDIG